jgi:hypothetical protein
VGVAFAAAWIAITRAGSPDIASGRWVPLGVVAAVGMIVFPQVAFVAGVLAALRAVRTRRAATLPAAEVALLLTRTRVALAFGALTVASLGVYAAEFRVPAWILPAAVVPVAVLAVSALDTRRAATVKSSVPGDAADVFDDLPIALPHRPWLLCMATAAAAALATFAAAPSHEGIRNGIVEVVLVLAGFLALGRRLGLRR